jgi:hypothetical protein
MVLSGIIILDKQGRRIAAHSTTDSVIGAPALSRLLFSTANRGNAMNRRFIRMLLRLAIPLAVHSGAALAAASYCVSDIDNLQSALNNAGGGSSDATVKIVRGHYTLTSAVFLTSTVPYAATMTGNPDDTIIDGSGLSSSSYGAVLVSFDGGNITLRNLTLQNFNVTTEVLTIQCHGGDMLVENNRFLHNTITIANDGPFYFISQVNTRAGSMTIRNNLIADTTVPDGMFAVFIAPSSSASAVVADTYFTNNTVVDTKASGMNPAGGVDIFTAPTSTPAVISNNILWNNAGGDLTALVAETLDKNDIGVQTGAANLSGSSGNVSVDPLFGGNYVLSSTSTLLDQGDPVAAGGVGTLDAWGMPRLTPDNTIDMGALQHDRIFRADFD